MATWNVVVGNYSLARNTVAEDHRVIRSTPHTDPIEALLDLEHAIIKGEAQEIGRGGTYRIEIDGNSYSLHLAARLAVKAYGADIRPEDDGWLVWLDNDRSTHALNAGHAVTLARRMSGDRSMTRNFPDYIAIHTWPRIVDGRGNAMIPEWSFSVTVDGKVRNGDFGYPTETDALEEAAKRARKHIRPA